MVPTAAPLTLSELLPTLSAPTTAHVTTSRSVESKMSLVGVASATVTPEIVTDEPMTLKLPTHGLAELPLLSPD